MQFSTGGLVLRSISSAGQINWIRTFEDVLGLRKMFMVRKLLFKIEVRKYNTLNGPWMPCEV
eukprot:scaffold2189_cov116-Cylindrotheca_fusiformis.AAC.5